MKVYILELGYDYEGTEVLNIFSSEAKALAAAEKFIEESYSDWEYIRPNVWYTSGQSLSVYDREVEE